MDQDISENSVEKVHTEVTRGTHATMVSVCIHHFLSSEREAELESFLEALAVRAVTRWVKL